MELPSGKGNCIGLWGSSEGMSLVWTTSQPPISNKKKQQGVCFHHLFSLTEMVVVTLLVEYLVSQE